MVIWIIGKSGVGKTFLSKKLYNKIKKKNKKIIWIDGDKFRKKYSRDLGYTKFDRKKNSTRMQKFCRNYEIKGFLVICSILSIFTEHQKRNKKLFDRYFQIYIRASNAKLVIRNKKNIYSKKNNVVGKHIKFPIPHKSDMVIKNSFDYKFSKNVNKIISRLNEYI